MRSLKKHKIFQNNASAIFSGILLFIGLSIIVYIIHQRQILLQHAQLTPPPAPPGCYYKPIECPAPPPCYQTDPDNPECRSTCNPVSVKLICPDISPNPSQEVTSSTGELKDIKPRGTIIDIFQNWFYNLSQFISGN